MKRALAGMTLALLLGACVFSSEAPLFSEDEAVTPFAEGVQFTWVENGGEGREVVTYHRAGAAYQIGPDGREEAIHALFIDLPETPEDDYIVQVRLRPEEPVRAYAYMWRIAGGYRTVASPGAFPKGSIGETAMQTKCMRMSMRECRFATAADVRAFYLEAVYPAFVVGDAIPGDYMDQLTSPPAPQSPPRK
ncbi:MAG: hypothetical protein R3C16_00965 [Hyphomonadaceae bacterium]